VAYLGRVIVIIGRTHAAAAICASTLIMDKISSSVVLGAFIGGIICDIDTKESLVAQLVPGVDNLWHVVREFAKKYKFNFIHDLLKHRGILTHSFVTVLISTAAYFVFKNDFTLALLIGISSHHFLDLISKGNLHYFAPLSNMAINVPLIKTGGRLETVFYYLITLSWTLYITKSYYFDYITRIVR
jgi:hypothetical protein